MARMAWSPSTKYRAENSCSLTEKAHFFRRCWGVRSWQMPLVELRSLWVLAKSVRLKPPIARASCRASSKGNSRALKASQARRYDWVRESKLAVSLWTSLQKR